MIYWLARKEMAGFTLFNKLLRMIIFSYFFSFFFLFSKPNGGHNRKYSCAFNKSWPQQPGPDTRPYDLSLTPG